MKHYRIGEVFLSREVVSRSELDYVLALQQAGKGAVRLGQLLIEHGIIDFEDLAAALATQSGLSVFNGDYSVDVKAVNLLGWPFLKENSLLPCKTESGNCVLISDVNNIKAFDHVIQKLGPDTIFSIGIENRLLAKINSLIPGKLAAEVDTIDPMGLIRAAIESRATDIHLESAQATLNVRWRVDGVLHFIKAYPINEMSKIINALFNKAGISAGDYLHFHDARFDLDTEIFKYDVRLSYIPSVHGPSLVLRLLDKSRVHSSLAQLGYSKENSAMINASLKRPHGLILFSGPTGCGKTTSLYALLNELRGLDVKVVTVEDPVEIQMPLVTQVMVNHGKGHDFHHVTRAILRHDPDVILLGEIRDQKTAAEALKAAVTGHRVLSTIHCNDVTSSILRLKDLGADLHMLSHALTCVVAQRLVRVLCSECKKHNIIKDEYEAVGCLHCCGGYRNRMAVAEVMVIDTSMRQLIEQGRLHELSQYYQSIPQQRNMFDEAKLMLGAGLTSQHELERVLG